MPSIDTQEGIQYRLQLLQDINTQILYLVYYGHFTYSDCEGMTSQELQWFYEGILEIQRRESEALTKTTSQQ